MFQTRTPLFATKIGWIEVTDWVGTWKSGGVVTAFVYDRGIDTLGKWFWGGAAEARTASRMPVARPDVASAKPPVKPPDRYPLGQPQFRFPMNGA
jgi:hypothetical protein